MARVVAGCWSLVDGSQTKIVWGDATVACRGHDQRSAFNFHMSRRCGDSRPASVGQRSTFDLHVSQWCDGRSASASENEREGSDELLACVRIQGGGGDVPCRCLRGYASPGVLYCHQGGKDRLPFIIAVLPSIERRQTNALFYC
ncbi:hypothetical protein E2C01_004611 [Portunus trituberculatus]|uniref:Uncharacterized protein n=1 Tax=Portunus trituberculatus TaxID=210409 RepID=A0A5B7CRT5_PORTR|nr:hypothetical protein [Portunus trituberculatus]